MPNIEIHGLNEGEAINKRLAMGIIIRRKAPELAEIVVVTIFSDVCQAFINNEPQPYLRICSSSPDHLEKLKEILIPLNMDIETLELKEFIPAKK